MDKADKDGSKMRQSTGSWPGLSYAIPCFIVPTTSIQAHVWIRAVGIYNLYHARFTAKGSLSFGSYTVHDDLTYESRESIKMPMAYAEDVCRSVV